MKILQRSVLLLSGAILLLTGCSKDNDPVAVNFVVVTPAILELNPEQAKQLTAKVSPDNANDKTVTWSSANQTIATVNASGKVIAVAVGQTTITATAGGKSATCAVSVQNKTLSDINLGDIDGWDEQGSQSGKPGIN